MIKIVIYYFISMQKFFIFVVLFQTIFAIIDTLLTARSA